MFETVDVIVDIENDRIELISEDKGSVIRLDLIGADALTETLRVVTGSKYFQSVLEDETVRCRSRIDRAWG